MTFPTLRPILSALLALLGALPLCAQTWEADWLRNYERRTVVQPDDYSGAVVSTIVRHTPQPEGARTAVVYVHGFNDYFFQGQLGDSVTAHGFAFYATDLRKYGRSWREGQTLFEVRRLREYFPDIDSTLAAVRADGYERVYLMGHSTGGLVCAYYLSKMGNARPEVCGLILNSPFLDMNLSPMLEKVAVPVASALSFLNLKFKQSGSTAYAQSLLSQYHGEWDYDTSLKLEASPVVTSRWLGAIHRAQRRLKRRAHIGVPILLLHSSQSIGGDEWTSDFNRADAVLDVADIAKYGQRLGDDVTEVTITDGMHDLILSRRDVRDETYRQIFLWMAGQEKK